MKTDLPTNNALGRNGQGLPGWASSSDFQDFEDGADGRLQAVRYGSGAAATTGDPFASQIADGVRVESERGIEPAGWVVQKFKPQIIDEAKRAGFNDREAQYIFERADTIPGTFFMNPARLNNLVTPEDDRAYRQQLERIIPDTAMRERLIKAYEKKFEDGTLKRVR